MKHLIAITVATVISLVAPVPVNGQSIEERNVPLQLIDDVEVASLDAGVVTNVHVVPGTYVGSGDVLLQLDTDLHLGKAKTRDLAWQVARAEASNDVNVRYSQKTLLVNGKVLEKSLNAVRSFAKSISETEIDKLRLERDQSELSIEQAQVEQEVAMMTAQLRRSEKEVAEIELDRRMIRSPLDGIVVDVKVQAGEAVGAAKPVIRIISTQRLRVIANVDRKYVFKLQNGDPAEFVVPTEDGAQSFPAKVVFVSPEIRFTEQTFDVWVEVQNSENKLLPGMKGNLTIAVSEHTAQ
ncbi:MAG: efflux RND transporter periplasmic adaptor subunit [Planctomycetota bacterium]